MLNICFEQKSIELRPQHHDEIHAVLKELKSKYPKIAASGYCWGGFYSIRLATHEDKVDCAIASHPSLVEVPKDIEDVKKPILFVCAEEDSQFGDEKREKTKEVLTQKGVDAEFQYYPGKLEQSMYLWGRVSQVKLNQWQTRNHSWLDCPR